MPKEVTQKFIEEKNKPENRPILLYQVQIDEDPLNDIFLTDYDENVVYLGHTWVKFPITIGDRQEGTTGRIDSFRIVIGNASREMQAFLELHNGLVGNKVTIYMVFADHLDDATCYAKDIFYIDTVSSNETGAEFTLSTKFDIMQVRLPQRRYARNHCQWKYKGEGCFRKSGANWVAPPGFVVGDDTCNKTLTDCAIHKNKVRFGAFPGIPSGRRFRVG